MRSVSRLLIPHSCQPTPQADVDDLFQHVASLQGKVFVRQGSKVVASETRVGLDHRILLHMGNSQSHVSSEKQVKVCTTDGTTIYEEKDKKTFRSTPDAAQNIMSSSAESSVDMMREGLRGVSDIHNNRALPSSSHQALSN